MILKDIEDIIDDMIDALKDNTTGINAQITAINTQKAAIDAARGRNVMTVSKFIASDGSETLTENQNLFFFMQQDFVNADPFMIVSIPNWVNGEMGDQNVTVTFTILTEDVEDGTDPKRKLLRYTRALREVLSQYLNQANDFINAADLSAIEPDFNQVFQDDAVRSFYSAGISVIFNYA